MIIKYHEDWLIVAALICTGLFFLDVFIIKNTFFCRAVYFVKMKLLDKRVSEQCLIALALSPFTRIGSEFGSVRAFLFLNS